MQWAIIHCYLLFGQWEPLLDVCCSFDMPPSFLSTFCLNNIVFQAYLLPFLCTGPGVSHSSKEMWKLSR